MGAFDIAITVILAAAFLAVASAGIYRKIKHKGGCSCGCEGCPCGKQCRKNK